jgi:hypothetical protein
MDMWLINRIALLILISISSIVLLILAILSPQWFSIYLAYITDEVFKFLYGTKKKEI